MATKYKGYMGKILDIDLSTKKISEYPLSDRDREFFAGGKYLATKILWDSLKPGIDPLGPENILLVLTSPLTGSGAPCSSRYNISAKSPLTGFIVHSNSGGHFGIHLKRAGFDGILIRGAAESPVYIEIDYGKVAIKDASHLWGLDTEHTQEKLGKGGKMVIGPAGENKVLYASIVSQERSHGRSGIGAVMGSKNLKAVVARGNMKVPVHNEELYAQLIKKWTNNLKKHPYTGDFMPRYGSGGFLNFNQAGGTLPTHDFSKGKFDRHDMISGETLAEKYMTRNYGCVSCPVQCGRRVKVGDKEVKGPEYETLALFGSNADLANLENINVWNYKMDLLGMDAISAGTTIGFAMELREKGLWDNGLSFGKAENISQILDDIAYRRGVGNDLANGVKRLAAKYGGEDFAPHVKGLELAAYEPRGAVGHGLGYATASRGGCHLDGGYIIFYERVIPPAWDPYDTKSKPSLVVMSQSMMGAVSSMGTCLFTALTALPPIAVNMKKDGIAARIVGKILTMSYKSIELMVRMPAWMLAIHPPFSMIPNTKVFETLTGMRFRMGELMFVGYRGYILERCFNLREGLTKSHDTLAKRFTNVQQIPGRPETVVKIFEMLPTYYRLRGMDENGIPKRSELKRLGLDFVKL